MKLGNMSGVQHNENIIQDSIDYSNTLSRWRVYEKKNSPVSSTLMSNDSKWKLLYQDLTTDETKYNFFKILEAWKNRDKLARPGSFYGQYPRKKIDEFEKLANMFLSIKTEKDQDEERAQIIADLEKVINEAEASIDYSILDDYTGDSEHLLVEPLNEVSIEPLESGYGSPAEETFVKKEEIYARTSTPQCQEYLPGESDFLGDAVLREYNKRTNKFIKSTTTDAIREKREIVYVCRANTGLLGSFQRIEAEKDLLLAMCKKEVHAITIASTNPELIDYLADVHIQDLQFNLRKKIPQKHMSLYLCVLRCGKRIEATEIVSAMDRSIKFANNIKFDDLTADCKIHIELYTLNVRTRKKSAFLRYTKKLFKKLTCDTKRYFNSSQVTVYNPYSAFKSLGTSVIKNVSSRLTEQNFKFENRPSDSSICDTFSAIIKVDVKFPHKMEGYALIGVEKDNEITWRNRWCKLIGGTVYFWTEKDEENDRMPSGALPLKNCASKVITAPALSKCRKPLTLCLKMFKLNTYNYENYYMCIDNSAEYFEWQQKLNFVLMSLRAWKEVSEQTWL